MSTHLTPCRRPSRQRGIALPAALFTLTAIALFVSGSAFLVLQETRTAVDTLSERRALEAAEYGATAVLRDWDPATNLSVAVGSHLGPWRHTLVGGGSATVHAIRATPTTFWVVSEGTAGIAGSARSARRVVGALLRLDVPELPVTSALAATDSVSVVGSGAVVGADTSAIARGLICSSTSAWAAGVGAPDTTRVCDGACGSAPSGRIVGLPPLLDDSMAVRAVRSPVGTTSVLATLAGRAIVTVPAGSTVSPAPVVLAGSCHDAAAGNWGDPTPASPCAAYLPIIHALGDVTLQGGVGQGILIADGDVTLTSGATFVGLVVAGDDIVMRAGGGTVLGAALAGDARRGNADHSLIGDGGVIRYSACAIRDALFAAAPVGRVRSRWWVELY